MKSYQHKLKALKSEKKQTNAIKKEISNLNEKIAKLNSVFEFYTERKSLYREDHLQLEDDDETAVMTLDFFKAECGNAGEHDYQDLICVLASSKELEIPQSLLGKYAIGVFTILIHRYPNPGSGASFNDDF